MLPGGEVDATVGERAGADLRAGQVGEHGDVPADLGGELADRGEPAEVLVDGAVAEVEPAHVGAGPEQPLQRRRVARTPDRAWPRSSCVTSHHACFIYSIEWAVLHGLCIDFLDASPSPWHAAADGRDAARRGRLHRASTRPTPWTQRRRRPGYVRRGGALVAWRRPTARRSALRIVGAHTDSPGLRDPPPSRSGRRPTGACSASRSTAACCSTAGSTATSASPAGSSAPTARSTLVDVDEPVARVPQLAIHLDRDVNERGPAARPARRTCARSGPRVGGRRPFAAWLAEQAGVDAGVLGAVPLRRAAGGRARRRPVAARQRPARQPGVVLGGGRAPCRMPSRGPAPRRSPPCSTTRRSARQSTAGAAGRCSRPSSTACSPASGVDSSTIVHRSLAGVELRLGRQRPRRSTPTTPSATTPATPRS